MSNTSHRQGTDVQITMSKRALQTQWMRLELKPKTLLHLQYVLDTWGPGAAATVTEVLVHEKKARVATFGQEWIGEELRILSRQGVRPVLLQVVRLLLESLAAWGVIQLSESALDGAIEITLAVLFMVTSCFGMWMASWWHRAKQCIRKHTPGEHSR